MRPLHAYLLAGLPLLVACFLIARDGPPCRGAAVLRRPSGRAALHDRSTPSDNGPQAGPEGPDLTDCQDIKAAKDGYLVTYERINKWGEDGIGFFNTTTDRWEWRQPAVAG